MNVKYKNHPENFDKKYRNHLVLTIVSEGLQPPTATYSLDKFGKFKGDAGVEYAKPIGAVVNKTGDFMSYGYAYDTNAGILFVKLKAHEINKGKVPRFCTEIKSTYTLRPASEFWDKFRKSSDAEILTYQMMDEKSVLGM